LGETILPQVRYALRRSVALSLSLSVRPLWRGGGEGRGTQGQGRALLKSCALQSAHASLTHKGTLQECQLVVSRGACLARERRARERPQLIISNTI